MIQIHSLVNRYYDPTTGQFISVDPLVDQTGQAYAYTGGDPVNGVDLMGLSALGNLGSFFAGVLAPITSAAAWFYNKIGESQIADLFKTIDQPFDCSPGAQESFKAGQATGATAAVAVPFVGEGTGLAGAAGVVTEEAGSAIAINGEVPQEAQSALDQIDQGRWPLSNSPGMKGGSLFGNSDGVLPTTNSSGSPITYQEWDVNPKTGLSRDSQRVVTGSDGSAYYTGDHYATFVKIR